MHRTRRPFAHPLAALLVAGALLIVATAAAAASPTLEKIRHGGTITLAYRDGASPFSFRDRDARVRGYSVELCVRVAAAIQKDLKLPELKLEWLPVDAATRLDAVASGRADVECGTTTVTLARMETVDFSLPIFVDGGSVLVRAKAKVARLADLKGKRIGIIAGTTTEQAFVAALSRGGATAILVPVKSPADGMTALLQGRIDAFAGDRVVLAGLRLHAPDPAQFELLGSDFSYEPYALVLRRDDPDFRLAVNRALAALYRSGDIDPIFQRWLAPLGQPGPLLHAMFYLSTLPE